MDYGFRLNLAHDTKKYFFEEIYDQDGGSVVLGNNKACKFEEIGSVRFKLHDKSIKL